MLYYKNIILLTIVLLILRFIRWSLFILSPCFNFNLLSFLVRSLQHGFEFWKFFCICKFKLIELKKIKWDEFVLGREYPIIPPLARLLTANKRQTNGCDLGVGSRIRTPTEREEGRKEELRGIQVRCGFTSRGSTTRCKSITIFWSFSTLNCNFY